MHLWVLFLKLQQERWVFDFYEVVYVLQAGFHQGHLRLHGVVPEGDGLSDCVFWGSHEVATQELDELVLNVLDEVQLSSAISVHDENGQKRVRLLDARVYHFDKDIGVVAELYHQFLVLLHVTERVFVH